MRLTWPAPPATSSNRISVTSPDGLELSVPSISLRSPNPEHRRAAHRSSRSSPWSRQGLQSAQQPDDVYPLGQAAVADREEMAAREREELVDAARRERLGDLAAAVGVAGAGLRQVAALLGSSPSEASLSKRPRAAPPFQQSDRLRRRVPSPPTSAHRRRADRGCGPTRRCIAHVRSRR